MRSNRGTGGGEDRVRCSTLAVARALLITAGLTAAGLLPAGLVSVGLVSAGLAAAGETGPSSGLPLPRFVSLKSDEVNLRTGPGKDYPTQWVFRRAGLPVEVVKEFEGWRQVRDAEGVTGWVSQSLISGRRTALVLPWDVKPDVPPPSVALRVDDSESARPAALVEAGVIANLQNCDSRWCYVTVDRFRGYVEQDKLWGIYPGEIIK